MLLFEGFSLSHRISHLLLCSCLYECDFACLSLEISMQLFYFPLLFPSFIVFLFLHLSSLNIYNVSMSSIRSKTLGTLINLTILWSICQISSLAHFKKSPEYLKKVEYESVKTFQLQSLVTRKPLFLQMYFLTAFFSACLMVSSSYIPKYLKFSFTPSLRMLSLFGTSLCSAFFFSFFYKYFTHGSSLIKR